MRKIQAAALLFLTLLAGCSTVPPSVAPPLACAPCPAYAACPAPLPAPVPTTPPAFSRTLQAAVWSDLPGWSTDDVTAAWPAFLLSCRGVASKPNGPGWKRVCDLARAADGTPGHDPRRFFEQHLQPYAIANGDGATSGMVTGYYEPLLRGSRSRTKGFEQPVRGVPDDLLTIDLSAVFPELKGKRVRGRLEGNKVLPYWSRAEITAHGEKLPGKTLLYVDDAVELFFLQVQGSGRIRLADGSVVRLNYADQNGHPYQSIGRALVERGELKLEEASMQGIQAWARANPSRLDNLLNSNPSYVFFREVPNSQDGPIGALGVPLTAERSIAIDPRSVPLGSPVFLATTRPNSGIAMNRLVMAQDTGGAIKGAVRADFFWGFGKAAGELAGRMKQSGRMWILLPPELAPN
ncbi:MAG: murein transglycosylase A [Gammaproteobacteria bacterium]|nr:murein transglycosylase A [Gammaproteobacteria bacterium]MBU1602450.1 murein transglycosylase A [Gammaproteobacteria bacterium]MBU2433255.1 murein transglycosylase A [Gammaproteobacteria bacterium]MBU2451171.1 murein transglycosylase A [Gammaproteobacteria bacterium]